MVILDENDSAPRCCSTLKFEVLIVKPTVAKLTRCGSAEREIFTEKITSSVVFSSITLSVTFDEENLHPENDLSPTTFVKGIGYKGAMNLKIGLPEMKVVFDCKDFNGCGLFEHG
uniref:Uncharacterized protein n=1 Tax=Romanomermis culicivorax TaxID=13658 RepID=A0A915HFN5_ROMCU